MATWRDRARWNIAKIVEETKQAIAGATIEDLRQAISKAYPWGPRQYWPYKMWCEEARAALGKPRRPPRKAKPKPQDPDQMALFEAEVEG